MQPRIPDFSPAERRIRREARSETLRERALALRQAGWTLARIGTALGVSTTRVYQMVRKARRLLAERVGESEASSDNEAGASFRGRPSDFHDGPFAADRTSNEQPLWLYPPPTI